MNFAKPSRIVVLSLLLVIVLFGLKLRLYKIDNPIADWHSWRQADTASVSRNFVKRGINLLHPKYDDISNIPSGKDNPNGYRFVEFPIANSIHALIARKLPAIDFVRSGRMLSVVYSLISIVLLFFLAKIHTDNWTALVSAFLFSMLPFGVYYSRVILPEPLIVTISLFFLLTFSLSIKNNRFLLLLISVFFFSILLLLKAYMAVFVIPAFAYLLSNKSHRNLTYITKTIVLFIISTLPFILWLNWAKRFPEGIPSFSWVFNGDGIRLRPSFFYWIFGNRIGILILGVWGVVPLILGIRELWKTRNIFMLAWIFALLSYLTIIATGNVRHDYYQAILIPAICIVVAVGLKILWKDSILSKIIAVFCLFMMLLISWKEIKGYYQINHWEIVEAGITADKILPESAKVIAPYNGDTAFLYQINRPGWPVMQYDLPKAIRQGATHYISVNFDDLTNQLASEYTVIKRTPRFIIIDITKSHNP